MDLLKPASDAVSAALRSGRIGTPVSARLVAHTASDPDQVEGLLGRAIKIASRWLNAEVERRAALGEPHSGQTSVLLEFRQGQTALVSVGTRGLSPALVELVVVGNRGIMSWEPGPPVVDEAGDARHLPEPPAEERGRPAASEEHDRRPRLVPTAPPYGVLLVAGGHTHQENYATEFAADRRCRLIGVTDERGVPKRRRALNEKLARSLGIPYFPDLAGALTRDDVHIVSICAEPERRAGVIIRCAEAGKHLYLDKPLAASSEEAEAVVAAIRKAGVVSQMFSQVRTPAAARLRKLLDGGALGDVRAVHFDLTFAKGPAGTAPIEKPRAESDRPRQFELADSKRELFNVGVYPLVLLDWLLGERVRRVRAVTANYFFAEHRRNDMEDFAVVLLELDGGAIATLAVGRTGWRSHPMGGLNRTCVIGTKGVASIDAYRPRWEVWGDELPWLPPRTDPQDPMGFWRSTLEESGAAPKQAWLTPPSTDTSDAAYFLDCIQQGRPSDVSAEVGAAAVKTLMAAYQSAATGRFVFLD